MKTGESNMSFISSVEYPMIMLDCILKESERARVFVNLSHSRASFNTVCPVSIRTVVHCIRENFLSEEKESKEKSERVRINDIHMYRARRKIPSLRL